MTEQTTFPFGGPLADPGVDRTGYAAPDRAPPADGRIAVTVVGTVRNERIPFLRSWAIWKRQEIPDWLDVRFLVLDDGSRPEEQIPVDAVNDPRVLLVRLRSPDAPPRSCTLAFNVALRQFVVTPYVLFQWWDRIPASFDHLRRLAAPHRKGGARFTSAVSRHIGGSSSMVDMTPEDLAGRLALVPWEADPGRLLDLCGPMGSHCAPGQASESPGLFVHADELRALGGWDERYTDQHSYVNVDLFRRLFGAGLRGLFPGAVNVHQSHGTYRERAAKRLDLWSDPCLVRNGGPGGAWGYQADSIWTGAAHG